MHGRLTLAGLVPACALALVFCGGPTKEPAPTADNPPAPASQAQPANEASGQTTASPPDFQPARATGAVQGVPAPTNTAPIIAMANYFADLPGMDLTALKPRQRESFLQRVNSELCTCGCKNDTLARCYVNDPRCPVVKGMVQKVLDEVKAAK